MTTEEINESFKQVRLSLIQRCIVAVEMESSQSAALKRLQEIELEIKTEE